MTGCSKAAAASLGQEGRRLSCGDGQFLVLKHIHVLNTHRDRKRKTEMNGGTSAASAEGGSEGGELERAQNRRVRGK